LASVRNGNRWRVAAVNPATNRLAAERLDDGARVFFENDYLREHVGLGYAVTVHSAQGVTADSTHAVLGENITRSMLYVAMTRARDANTAYLYERATEQEYGPTSPDGPHVLQRGTSGQAAPLARTVIDTYDDVPVTAHQVAANTRHHLLPDRMRGLLMRRGAAVQNRHTAHTEWQKATAAWNATMSESRVRATERSRSHGRDSGIEL
jgi:hypothetical protein